MLMNLIALNSKYIHSNPAVYSLRAYATKKYPEYAEDILISEYTINLRSEDILAAIYRNKASVAAFSCYIWNISQIYELITELHKLCPTLPIWLGGPEVTYNAPEILRKYPFLAGIMIGEGEETFSELLHCYETGKDNFKDIAGLCLKNGYTARREITEMKEIPFWYEDSKLQDTFQNRIIYYESSRGCPFRCSYCLSSIEKELRFRDLSLVKKQLQFFLDKKVPQVKFIDRTFNCNHTHAYEIWNYIQEHDNGITNFHFEIAADIMTDEEITLLNQMRPGLVQLEIGVQTTNLQTLESIDRRMNLSRLREVVNKLRERCNMHIHLDLIAGLPKEDYTSFMKSFNDVFSMHPEQLQLGFLKVLKGSRMYEQAAENGICYRQNPPYEVLYTDFISYEEILGLKEVEEMLEQYYNSGQYKHIITVLLRKYETPFLLFRALADYYKEKGYTTNSPSRLRKYEILLEFAAPQNEQQKRLYTELILFDLYLREDLKSRPEFAYPLLRYQNLNTLQKQLKSTGKQFHVEGFTYPVWNADLCHEEEPLEVPCFLLFDYSTRNPLDNDAVYTLLENEKYQNGLLQEEFK